MHDYWEKAREHARVAMGDLITQAEWDEFFDKTIPSFQSVAAPASNP